MEVVVHQVVLGMVQEVVVVLEVGVVEGTEAEAVEVAAVGVVAVAVAMASEVEVEAVEAVVVEMMAAACLGRLGRILNQAPDRSDKKY